MQRSAGFPALFSCPPDRPDRVPKARSAEMQQSAAQGGKKAIQRLELRSASTTMPARNRRSCGAETLCSAQHSTGSFPMSLRAKFGILAAGLLLSGCMQGATYEATNTANFKPRDRELLARTTYAKVPVAEPFRRAIVDYHRREAPGSIGVDSDNHYLYFVLKDGKAIRYGITVGEEAMAWSGIAKVGSKAEWPAWHPTKGEISRLGVPTYVAPGPDNPMGSRAMYLYSGGKDTLFRIHGTNQPEYIGASISSGCIRMTNEDAIDLYDRAAVGTVVVVLEPKHGDSPFNSKMALQGGGGPMQQ